MTVWKRFSDVRFVKSFIVVVCSRCGGYLIAKSGQKTKTCSYCGFRLAIERAKKIADAESAQVASSVLRKLKTNSARKKNQMLSRD